MSQTAHNHPTRSEPSDRYDGPILPGQRWRSRGTGKHQPILYTVVTFNGRTAKVSQEGNRRSGGRLYNIPEPAFRGNFNLVAQPKGVLASDLPTLAAEQQRQLQGGLVATKIVAVEPPTPDPIDTAIAETKPPRPLSRLVTVEEQVKMQMPDPPMAPVPPPPPPPAPTESGYAALQQEAPPENIIVVPTPTEAMAAWIEGGRRMVEALDRELGSVTVKRDAVAEQLAALNTQLNQIAQQRAQIEQAVQAALAIANGTNIGHPLPGHPILSPPLNASPKPGQTGNQPENKARPGGAGKTSWVLDQAVAAGEFSISELIPAYCGRWGRTPAQATGDVGGILAHHVAARNENFPALERLGGGRYRVVA